MSAERSAMVLGMVEAAVSQLQPMFAARKALSKTVQRDPRALRRELLARGFGEREIEAAWAARYRSTETAARHLIAGRERLEIETVNWYVRQARQRQRALVQPG